MKVYDVIPSSDNSSAFRNHVESDSNAPERGAPWERITEEEFVARVRAVKFGSSVPASASRESVLIELALATGITDEHIEAYIAGIADATTRTVARLESQRPTWRRAHPPADPAVTAWPVQKP